MKRRTRKHQGYQRPPIPTTKEKAKIAFNTGSFKVVKRKLEDGKLEFMVLGGTESLWSLNEYVREKQPGKPFWVICTEEDFQ